MKESSHDLPGLKQFRHENCFSYVLFDRRSREALIIDPRADRLDDYRSYFGENGLKPKIALDTHLHSDHFSGTHLLKAEYGLSITMSARTLSTRPDWRVSQGESIVLGALEWGVFETPGHTEDSIVIQGSGMLFTGDALWSSLREWLERLPDATLLFPGHDSSGLLFSLVEIEKIKNRHDQSPKDVSGDGVGDSARLRIAFNSTISPQEGIQTWATFSAQGDAGREPASRVSSMNVEKYAQKLKEPSADVAFVDVREAEEFEKSSIPGTLNIPLSEIPFNLEVLRKAKRIYISCLSGRRSLLVANTLNYLGFPDVINVLGGLHSWGNRGLPLKGAKN